MSELYILSVVTESKYYYPYLLETCKKFGKELITIGYNEKWLGYNWKFIKILEFIKNYKKDDIICFIDGYDVIAIRNLTELKKNFEEIQQRENCKIITGHDKSSFKNSIIQPFLFKQCKNLYLNSGSYIGYVKDIDEILSNLLNINNETNNDDQVLLTEYCINNPNDFYIDIKNEIFFVYSDSFNEIDNIINFENGEIVINKEKPFFIHGPASTYLNNILVKLNYNISEDIKNNLFNDFFQKKIYYLIKHHLGMNFEFILFILIIIIFIILLINKNYNN